MPSVSVIIPTYNRCAYVQEAIDSVLAQTFGDYEIIVVDDGSTDGTGEALRAGYGGRIHYERQQNRGASAARNRAAELARGRYIAFLDSDDHWLPDKLARQVAFLDENPGVAMVFSRAWRMDAGGRRDSDRVLGAEYGVEALEPDRLCMDNCVTSPTVVMLRADAFRAAGGFDPAIRHCEDWELWLRLRLAAGIHMQPEPLALIRRHSGGLCHYPSTRENANRRAARLATLDRFFALWPAAPEGLRRRAIAWQYAYSAVQEMVVGDRQACRSCLEQVAAHDASLLVDSGHFGMAIAGYAALLYEGSRDNHLADSRSLVRAMLDAVAETGHDSRSFRRATWTQAYASLGFTAHEKGDMRTARYGFIRALALRPSLARNTGLLSLLFESTAGRRASHVRRTLWSRLRARTSAFTRSEPL